MRRVRCGIIVTRRRDEIKLQILSFHLEIDNRLGFKILIINNPGRERPLGGLSIYTHNVSFLRLKILLLLLVAK